MRKQKGISLIVLIITIVVIIILATTIIVNIAQTNMIKNANVAVLKNDLQTFNEELQLYKAEQLLNTEVKFNPDALDANYENILHNGEIYQEGQDIYNILTKLKGSKYDKVIYVQEGKIVVDSEAFTEEQLAALKDINVEAIDVSLRVKIASISSYNSVTVKMIVTLGEVEKYYFKLGESGSYIESETNEYTFEGLDINTEYTVYMKVLKADGEESVEYTEIVRTKDITGEVTITKNPNLANGEYTSEDVKITLSYGENIPDGYVLQYKTSDTDWVTYTSEITITENTTVYGRLYNATTDDEKASNSSTITGIDKTAPTAEMAVENVTGKTELSVTVTASDSESGISKIMCYYKKETGTEYTLAKTINLNGENEVEKNFVITGLESETSYDVYVEVYDKAENSTQTDVVTQKTPKVYEIVFDNTNGTENTTINGKDFAYNNPVVPVGFMAVNTNDAKWTEDAGWNDGLVIVDVSGNEFVWVPVDGTSVTYAKNFTYPSGNIATAERVLEDESAVPIENESTQITTYSGFYIGRYEAGVPEGGSASNTTGIPTTQQGATVWTNINYTNANTNAMSFMDTDNVKSGLVTGTQWDTIMKWISNSGINVTTDSNAWGNYSTSISPANVTGYGTKKTAGYSEYWKAKNIYDLAGNVWEWSGEKYSLQSNVRFYRGGYYGNAGVYSASYRYCYYNFSSVRVDIGFRIVLYVM